MEHRDSDTPMVESTSKPDEGVAIGSKDYESDDGDSDGKSRENKLDRSRASSFEDETYLSDDSGNTSRSRSLRSKWLGRRERWR
jgi:hypothetical protein